MAKWQKYLPRRKNKKEREYINVKFVKEPHGVYHQHKFQTPTTRDYGELNNVLLKISA
jgi:hypothetical protein